MNRDTLLKQADDWTPPPVIPYVWGGTTRQGADCSGFVIGVFRELNEPMPQGVRTAEQIRQVCEPVTRNDARPGDLIFFEHTYANPDEIDRWGPDGRIATHIGFVVDWGYPTRMLDTHEWVHYTPITAYWDSHFLGIGRPPQITDSTDEEIDMEWVNSFLGNAIGPDGEIKTALQEIQKNMLESDLQSAQGNIDALEARVDALWKEWTG
jgi:hypothetical protein